MITTSYFHTQEKLIPKQAKYFLAKFDYTLEYKPRRANHIIKALKQSWHLWVTSPKRIGGSSKGRATT